MSSTGERLQLRSATGDPAAVDPLLLQNLCDMGFEEHASRAALAATSCRNLEVAIDFMMSNPAPSASAAGASAAAAAPAAAAAAPAPVPEKVMSSFDLEAREAHKQREMEERTRKVKEEQKRKREHEKKVKQQVEEDKMVRKMKPVVARASKLTIGELTAHAEAIASFFTENGRKCDELDELRTRLLAHVANLQGGGSEGAAAASAGAEAAHDANRNTGGSQQCMVRVRLADGSQVTQTLASDATLRSLHSFVTERQGGDDSFSFIVPGPPGLRQEFGEDKLGETLQALGLVPSASLTVQALSKRDMVTVAPEGSEFAPAQQRGGRGMSLPMPSMGMGGRGGLMRMGGGRMRDMRGGQRLDGEAVEDDEEEASDDEEDVEDSEEEHMMGSGLRAFSGMGQSLAEAPATMAEEAEAFARAQTESMDMATNLLYSGSGFGVGGLGTHSQQCSGLAGPVRASGGMAVGEDGPGAGVALDEATRAGINALNLAKVKIPEQLLDPLTQQLMLDPVKLPCSGTIMDRTTILRHLKTNSTDPYTNTELRATSLMPASELLPKYKAWLARCRAACN